MIAALTRFVERELAVPVPHEVQAVAARLADRMHGVAVLYYGSTLRTGDLDGVLDFYVLTDGLVGNPLRRAGMRWLWPDVSYHEVAVDGRTVRAKVASMPLATFERAASGRLIDTTVWTRFVQPAALVWQVDADIARRVVEAVGEAAITAARFAAVLGPRQGSAQDFWLALFRETYGTEWRVEPPGREATILLHDPARYARLLPIAWQAGGVAYADERAALAPLLNQDWCRGTVRAWLVRAGAGKALNIARLIKASFTFEGATRYALWKLHRHTGVRVALTPWRERHPVLAAPTVLWQVMRRPA